ncbi:MAG: MFS transporter [Verrucomicrobiota bacterium]
MKTAPTSQSGAVPHWYKWEMLVVLWIAFFLHQGCRQIYNSVIPLIKTDLGLTDVQAGLVSSIFTLVYGVLVPVAGLVGDRFPRKWIIFASLLVFSSGTLLTGFSTSLVMMVLLISITTGGGEAFFYPSTTSLLAQFHEKTRALALGLLQTGLYIGITVSGLLAGWIGQTHGWRNSFLVFGGAGILWTIVIALRLRNSPLPAVSTKSTMDKIPTREVLSYLMRRPTVWMLSLAFGGMVFVGVGYMTWMPTFLYEKFHLSVKDAALNSMLYHFSFAFLGVLVGGRVSDGLAARRPTIRMEIGILGLLLGAPFIWLMGASTNLTIVYVALAGFGFFRGLYDSNLFAALYDVIPARYRSSATGLMLSCAFTVGATSPVLLGYLKQHINLGIGLSALAFVYFFGAALLFIALKVFFARDYVRE